MRTRYVRFQADNVAHQLSLIALVVAHLAGPVDHLHALQPLFRRQIDLTCKIVNVLDKSAQDGSHPRGGVWAHCLDNMVGEILAQGAFV